MKTTKIFPVFIPYKIGSSYDRTTKNFKEGYNKAGVYIIFKLFRPGKIEPVYVGSSKNVGKTFSMPVYPYKDAKFFDVETGGKYNKNGQYRTSFADQKRNFKFFVKFYFFSDSDDLTENIKQQIAEKEYNLISKLEPKYNRNLKTSADVTEAIKTAAQKKAEQEAIEIAENYKEYKEEFKEYINNPEEIDEPPF